MVDTTDSRSVDVDLSGECKHSRSFYFQCGHCGRLVKLKAGCGKRFDSFCEPCARKWRYKTKKKYFAAITSMRAPKFVTLTLKKDERVPAEERMTMLWEYRRALIRELRRRGYRVGAWCAVIEPPNHIHMVMDSDFVPQHTISEIWHAKTHDSYIVDIRKVNVQRDPRNTIKYLTKYLGKASAWDGINLDLLEGFHLIGSHGCSKVTTVAICLCGVKDLHKIMIEDYYAIIDSVSVWKPPEDLYAG
jgi:REP element-mobilizing transposase RayT